MPDLSLVERLMETRGPDRRLGDEVLLAGGWERVEAFPRPYPHDGVIVWVSPSGERYDDGVQPNPLASLDAARTLVPETHRIGTLGELFSKAPQNWMAVVLDRDVDKQGDETGHVSGRSDNPAIALCIAALKARGIK